jgi:lysophospholipase L1-like esterase
LAAGVAAAGPLSAQPDFAAHHQRRVAAFSADNQRLDPGQRTVVLVGDSLTEGFGNGGRQARFLPTLASRTLNRGIGGDRAGSPRGVLDRMQASVFDCQASHVFLLVGVNQIGREGRGIAGTARDYESIVKQIRKRLPQVKLIAVTTPPTRGRFAHLNDPIQRYNLRVREIAGRHDVPVLDLHGLLAGPDGSMPADMTRDGLHFNDLGYAIYGREIERRVSTGAATAGRDGTGRGLSGAVSGDRVGPGLGRGDANGHVAWLQLFLNQVRVREGQGRIGVDGAFGPGTEAAVREFQRLSGHAETGAVDGATWRALTAANASGPLGSLNPTAFPTASTRYARRRDRPRRVNIYTLPKVADTQPLIFESKMAIDADGAGETWRGDRTGQPETSLTYRGGRSVDPTLLNFFVLPIGFEAKHPGVKLGDLAAVTYRGKVAYAIYADRGPRGQIGEGSVKLARALGINADPNRGGASGGVTYVVFPGSGTGRPLPQAEIDRRGSELNEKALAAAR